MAEITLFGGGSWATALVKILSEGDNKINWVVRSAEVADYINQNGSNPKYLCDIEFHTSKVMAKTMDSTDVYTSPIVVFAMPAAFIQETLDWAVQRLSPGSVLISAAKGMIPAVQIGVSDYLELKYAIPASRLAFIGGPCHSEEVAMKKRSYLTLAHGHGANGLALAELFCCDYVGCHALEDLKGVEYCAILKNIFALAAGMAHGLGYGDNFLSVLVSNAMHEVEIFLDGKFPSSRRQLTASAYLGDLLVTAYSQHSRNRTFGAMIGRGYSIKAAQIEMNMVAEGYYASKSLSESNADMMNQMPIVNLVYHVLYKNIHVADAFKNLEKQMK
jgi:glycerol-3-phosphate dehydrogenase (NAD(P)+)